MSRITTAVIMAAGYGTRRLPITKAVEKGMLPIGNRPLIDYVVSDAARAGITKIIFVVGEQSEQLRTYYGNNQQLNKYLQVKGKAEMLAQVNAVGHGLEFEFVIQPMDKYGTAAAVYAAAKLVRGEPGFLVLNGDCFTLREGGSDLVDLMQAWKGEGTHAMLCETLTSDKLIQNFGILETVDNSLSRMLEKPRPGTTDSRLINLGMYAFSATMLVQLDSYMATKRNDEYYLTDPIQMLVDNHEPIRVVPITGEYLDGGNETDWLYANNIVIGSSSS